MTNPWLDPHVALEQRRLVDAQLQQSPPPSHFRALVDAVRATQCPGEVLVVGCGVGHEREVLDRAGVEYRSFTGVDISPTAIALAKERYPESLWLTGDMTADLPLSKSDVVVDSALLMHVDNWRGHLAALCAASRRWVILHRVPLGAETARSETHGYGQTFPAWNFSNEELLRETMTHGYRFVGVNMADGDSRTYTFAKPRHWVSYCDSAYLPRLKALHASMAQHCGPFHLEVLAWDQGVADWCDSTPGVVAVEIEDFLAQHPGLRLEALPGPPRTRVEHMWTVGPSMVAATMEKYGEPVTYVDADLYAFSSPEPFFAEAGGSPAAFVGHNFAPASRNVPGPAQGSHTIAFGALNVGLAHFNDVRVAAAWAEMVRRWCFDRREVVGGQWQFADQKYLEQLAVDFHAVVIKNEAAMVGPWNVNARALWTQDGVPHFGGRPIGFYHFSSLQLGPHGQWSPSRPEYCVSEHAVNTLYVPYLRALQEAK